MAKAQSTGSTTDQTTEPVTRSRNCLRCETSFQSEWAGERICHRCKSTAAWRAGTPVPAYPASKRK